MLFNSIEFLLFFPLVTLVYFLLPHKFRWIHLLLSSCIFYMFFIPVYILILFFTIFIDYYAGIFIEECSGAHKRKKWLTLSIIANVGVLAIFKYYNFFTDNVNSLLAQAHIQPIPYLNIILPIGLSFHTFQAMSYTIEVYRGTQKAERHLGIYALYVMFYPQLVAGPIERPQNILHQFYEKHVFEYSRVVSGLRLMLWGMFKKVVIADRLSMFVDAIYDNPGSYEGLPLLWSALFFSFQIYCDFSGYSDIARGSARVMDFELMKNFNAPYIATNIKEFWSRWHISLSTWFRDYLYIPLGGNRVSGLQQNKNLFVVFLTSGLWHGANWTFIIWGGLHGIAVLITNIPKKLGFTGSGGKISKGLGWIFTFALVTLFWIFFRAPNLTTALTIISHSIYIDPHILFGVPLFTVSFYIICMACIVFIFIADALLAIKSNFVYSLLKHRWVNYIYFFTLTSAIYILGIFEKQSFIYFQF